MELIEDLPADAEISTYRQGEFVDLCAGPHVASTGKVKAFKLQSLAGAYWRGDEKNKMLQRIYGTAFEKKEELDEYLHLLEEAARRDHRKLGKELAYSYSKNRAPGFPFFLPKGWLLRNELENFLAWRFTIEFRSTKKFVPQSSWTANFGNNPVTGSIIVKTCTLL